MGVYYVWLVLFVWLGLKFQVGADYDPRTDRSVLERHNTYNLFLAKQCPVRQVYDDGNLGGIFGSPKLL